jgi:hypothetical protein
VRLSRRLDVLEGIAERAPDETWRASCDRRPARRYVMGIGILGLIGAIVVIFVVLRILGLV